MWPSDGGGLCEGDNDVDSDDCGEDDNDDAGGDCCACEDDDDDESMFCLGSGGGGGIESSSFSEYNDVLGLLKPRCPYDGSTCEEDLQFLVIDISLRPSADKTSTEAVLIGREANGASVCVFVKGWQPYLYIEAPRGWLEDCNEILLEMLEEKLQSRLQQRRQMTENSGFSSSWKKARKQNNNNRAMYSVTTVQRKSIFGYSPSEKTQFLKLEVAQPFYIRSLVDVFEGYEALDGKRKSGIIVLMDWANRVPKLIESGAKTQTFNSNLDPVLQFMVDVGLGGCQWCKIEGGRDDGMYGEEPRSSCHYENEIRVNDLNILSLDEYADLGPLRVLSFDIEAAGRRGVFPDALLDPVIQIAVHFYVVGAEKKIPPILLSLKSCDDIEDVNVLCFENELEMLRMFSEIVLAFDADVLTGYNICNFDFPYLLKRATALGDEGGGFEAMTRLVGGKMFIRETVFQSAQTGKRKRVRVGIAGRFCLDMFTSIQNNQSYRLEKYSLNAVSEYFLGDQKVDIPFTQITPMWEKGAATRRELGIYCLKDAQLPIDLMLTLDSLTQTIEIARCTCTPGDWVMQRGVMVRNTSLLLRRAKERDYVFPNVRQSPESAAKFIEKNKGFEGATVLDAHAGIHKHVGVLDFSAMYPSIIRAHNLCYSTIVLDSANEPKATCGEQLLRVNGHCFVPEGVVKGLIPEVVEILQDCRTKAKKAYAAATDPVKKKTCKAREMAFKVAGNGMYGAMGSTQSLLPLLAVAETVTAIGRNDIRSVKRLAEEMYPDALVVYGDTDSVFVRFCMPPGVETVIDSVSVSMDMAKALAEKVNLTMKFPKNIEFEKVYHTWLCLSKKRYAGIMYAAGHKFGDEPPIDIKGMQCVRRDGCALVRDLVRECLMSILHTGTFVDAAATARLRLLEIFDDKIVVDSYAIQKVLRKSMQDCCFPMTSAQICEIRKGLSGGKGEVEDVMPGAVVEQLSYAEQDEAIRKKIPLPWKLRIRLPHVMLAWRMRLQDPGSAPVLGETLSYVVTNNGGKQIFEKVNTLEAVKSKKLFVDRQYYLNALKVPLENIFLPICIQEIVKSAGLTTTTSSSLLKKKENEARARAEVDRLIWRVIKGKALKYESVSRRESVEASPIAQAFKRAAAASMQK
jgi:DNA polymerase delta subunit 1